MISTAELVRVAGVTKRMVHYWIGAKVIKPRRRHWGRGNRRFFDDDQVFKTLIVRELRRRGVRLTKIRRLKLMPIRADYLLLFRNRVEWASKQTLIDHIKRLHSPVLLVSVHDLRMEFCLAMERRAGGYYTASLPDRGAVAAA